MTFSWEQGSSARTTVCMQVVGWSTEHRARILEPQDSGTAQTWKSAFLSMCPTSKTDFGHIHTPDSGARRWISACRSTPHRFVCTTSIVITPYWANTLGCVITRLLCMCNVAIRLLIDQIRHRPFSIHTQVSCLKDPNWQSENLFKHFFSYLSCSVFTTLE